MTTTTIINYTDERGPQLSSVYNMAVQVLVANHGINTKVISGKLMVEEVYTRADQEGAFAIWHDATGWTIRDAFNWLGY